MRVSNKTLYAILCDIECELEILSEKVEELGRTTGARKATVVDLDQPKRKPGRPRKNH